jgi:UDP-2,3-diacylglucosamine hydrolase
VAIVAGSGALPVEVAQTLVRLGHQPFVILLEGEARAEDFGGCETTAMALEEFCDFVAVLRGAGASHMIFAGGVARRPALSRMKWRLGMLRLVPRIAQALTRGDDGLLRAVLDHFEASGFKVLGAHKIVPDLLAPLQVLTRRAPSKNDERDIAAAFEAATAIGRLDIGQAAIAVGGRAVALEGIEGTDGLLSRMASMRDHGRLAGRTGGVLVKCAKPGQETRVDLPAIGPGTVDGAHAAGLSGIAVEAGHTFMLDAGRVIARADELGISSSAGGARNGVTSGPALRIGIVAGEESGDLLGADLINELQARTGRAIELCGVGGRHLGERPASIPCSTGPRSPSWDSPPWSKIFRVSWDVSGRWPAPLPISSPIAC